MKTVRVIAILMLFTSGGAALFGGASLLADPSGRKLRLPLELLEGTPFNSYLVPGFVLFVAIGILGIVAGILTAFRHNRAPEFTILHGGILSAWIVIQVYILHLVNVLQIACGGIGFILVCLGLMLADEKRIPRYD